MATERLSDEAMTHFDLVVRTAGQFGFYGPDVMATPVTDDPDVFGHFDALDRFDDEWWVVTGVLVATDFGPVVRSLVVQPWPPDDQREVTSGVLRRIKPADLRDRAFVALRFGAESISGQPVAEDATRIEAVADTSPRRGRKPLPDSHYRRIALAYLNLLAERNGRSRGLINALAEREGELPETVRGWIYRARRKGFLTKGRRGLAGAAPGPRLYEGQPNSTEEES